MPGLIPYTSSGAQSVAHQQHFSHLSMAHSQIHVSQLWTEQRIPVTSVEQAIAYIDAVKQKCNVNELLDIMKDNQAQKDSLHITMQRVHELFKNYPELIIGFNNFLPPDFQIEMKPLFDGGKEMLSGDLEISESDLESSISSTDDNLNILNISRLNHHLDTVVSKIGDSSFNSSNAFGLRVSNTSPFIESIEKISDGFNTSVAAVTNNINCTEMKKDEISNSNCSSSSAAVIDISSIVSSGDTTAVHSLSEKINYFSKKFLSDESVLTDESSTIPTSTVCKFNVPTADTTDSVAKISMTTTSVTTTMASIDGNTTINTFDSTLSVNGDLTEEANMSRGVKRPNFSLYFEKKKLPKLEDDSLSQVGRYGSLNEFTFFDKVKKALRNQEIYENFLRCLMMHTQDIISRAELIEVAKPFLGKLPELYKWFKDFLHYQESDNNIENIPNKVAVQEKLRLTGDPAMEVDYSSCKQHGVSYRALPKNYVHPKCSGRSALCREVLNDTWVSFPSWSEDSTFGSTSKTQFEEIMYRCEDERFELDIALEANMATIRVLESIQKKITKMNPEERNMFHLDDTLGGSSSVIHHKAIRRIYGDKSTDIIEGLKKNPQVAVPLVLRRLKAKEEEWREAQKNFNYIWREQIDKFYLKSLDHQGVSFKQNDIKYLRSKCLLNEIETIYEERKEQQEEGSIEVPTGCQLAYFYQDKNILHDAADLIIYYVKNLPGMHKEDKMKIATLLRGFVLDYFFLPPQDITDDFKDNEEVQTMESSNTENTVAENMLLISRVDDSVIASASESTINSHVEIAEESKQQVTKEDSKSAESTIVSNIPDKENILNIDQGESYSVFYGNNNWYLFFRLHQILCQRLYKMMSKSYLLIEEKENEKKDSKFQVGHIIENPYLMFLSLIRKLLEGNLDSSQFEDTIRYMFGIDAYISFTIDKLLQNIVRQLQHIISDEACIFLTELSIQENKLGITKGTCASAFVNATAELEYRKKVEQKLLEENCFKIVLYKNEGKITMELLDNEMEPIDEPAEIQKWSSYVDGYVVGGQVISEDIREHLLDNPIFLVRNLNKWKSLVKAWRRMKIECETENYDEYEDNLIENEDCEELVEMKTASISSREEKGEVSENYEPSLSDASVSCTDDDFPIYFNDNTQCKFTGNAYKLSFVANTGSFMYKWRALIRARDSHYHTSIEKSEKFSAWHKSWLEKHTTPALIKVCQDWMIKEEINKYRTVCFSENHITTPPYGLCNRYRVLHYKT